MKKAKIHFGTIGNDFRNRLRANSIVTSMKNCLIFLVSLRGTLLSIKYNSSEQSMTTLTLVVVNTVRPTTHPFFGHARPRLLDLEVTQTSAHAWPRSLDLEIRLRNAHACYWPLDLGMTLRLIHMFLFPLFDLKRPLTSAHVNFHPLPLFE